MIKLLKKIGKKFKREDKYYNSRRAAFRAAKRDSNIPVSSQPVETITPKSKKWKKSGLDSRNKRLYIFRIFDFFNGFFQEKEVHIREDKAAIYTEEQGHQIEHFNVGEPPKKLKKHFYFLTKQKK